MKYPRTRLILRCLDWRCTIDARVRQPLSSKRRAPLPRAFLRAYNRIWDHAIKDHVGLTEEHERTAEERLKGGW